MTTCGKSQEKTDGAVAAYFIVNTSELAERDEMSDEKIIMFSRQNQVLPS
jgi:hypothetical protein